MRLPSSRDGPENAALMPSVTASSVTPVTLGATVLAAAGAAGALATDPAVGLASGVGGAPPWLRVRTRTTAIASAPMMAAPAIPRLRRTTADMGAGPREMDPGSMI